jgi:hypothetical protein
LAFSGTRARVHSSRPPVARRPCFRLPRGVTMALQPPAAVEDMEPVPPLSARSAAATAAAASGFARSRPRLSDADAHAVAVAEEAEETEERPSRRSRTNMDGRSTPRASESNAGGGALRTRRASSPSAPCLDPRAPPVAMRISRSDSRSARDGVPAPAPLPPCPPSPLSSAAGAAGAAAAPPPVPMMVGAANGAAPPAPTLLPPAEMRPPMPQQARRSQ